MGNICIWTRIVSRNRLRYDRSQQAMCVKSDDFIHQQYRNMMRRNSVEKTLFPSRGIEDIQSIEWHLWNAMPKIQT